MKSLAKAAIQKAAEYAGPQRWSRSAPRLWILMYHRIIPARLARQECEEPGMFVTPETFALHLKWIAESLEVCRLADWVGTAASGGRLPSKACAITFDDGWQDNYEYAFPLLADAKMPATVFAVSSYVGTHRLFWPNRIARLAMVAPEVIASAGDLLWLRDAAGSANIDLATIPGDREAFSRLIAACKALQDGWIHQVLDAVEARVPGLGSDRKMLDWNELAQMQQSGVFDVGSHTRNHQRLTAGLDPVHLEDEIVGSCRELEHHLGVKPSTFCYPNGDLTLEAETLVSRTYLAAVTTRRGINGALTPRETLLRVGLHEDAARTRGQFFARLAGWL